jgi:hypothetical protein
MLLTSLDDVEVLGVNIAVLWKVEVLLCNKYALCGDRVSAYPCMQQAAAQTCIFCHSHGASGEYTNRGRGTCESDGQHKFNGMLQRDEGNGKLIFKVDNLAKLQTRLRP